MIGKVYVIQAEDAISICVMLGIVLLLIGANLWEYIKGKK
jgi:hypothetical protein